MKIQRFCTFDFMRKNGGKLVVKFEEVNNSNLLLSGNAGE